MTGRHNRHEVVSDRPLPVTMGWASRVRNAFDYPVRFLFGDDVFISYSRADGITYAEGLASELTKRGFSCRLDLWETTPGPELPAALRRSLRWSKMLVLIGTNGAVQSRHVGFELSEFLTTSGIVVPIGFGNGIFDAGWFGQIQGLPITYENDPMALTTGKPSTGVLSRIENAVRFTRRNRRIRDLSAVAFAVLLTLIALSAVAGRNAVTASKEAARQQAAAGAAATEAVQQRSLADRATQDRAAAERRASDATSRAELAQQDAAEQEHRAAMARKAAELEEQGTGILRRFQSGIGELESLEAAIRSGRELLPLVPAGASWADYPAASPVAALNTIVANIHEQNRLTVGSFGMERMTVSSDGTQVAIIRREDKFVNGQASLQVYDLSGKPMWSCALPEGGLNDLSFERGNKGVVLATHTRGLLAVDASCQPRPLRPGDAVSIGGHYGLFAESSADGGLRILNAPGFPLATVQMRVLGSMTKIRAHPSAKLILAADPRGPLRAWRNGQWVGFFNSPAGEVDDFDFTPDGDHVLIKVHGGTFYVLDIHGNQVTEIKAPDRLFRLSMNPIEAVFATAEGGVVHIWHASGESRGQFSVPGSVSDVQFSPDGSRLLVVAFDTVRLFTAKGEPLLQLAGHAGAVRQSFLLPGAERVVTAGSDSTVRAWDVSDRASRKLTISKFRVEDLAFFPSPHPSVLAIARDGIAGVWAEGGQPKRQWKSADWVLRAKISPDRKRLALLTEKRMEIRDAEGGLIPIVQGTQGITSSTVLTAAFSPDSSLLALSQPGGSILFLNLPDGKRFSRRTSSWVYALAFDPSGSKLVAALARGGLLFLDRNGSVLSEVGTGQVQLLDVAFSPDGRYLATAGVEGSVALWTSGGQSIRRIYGHSARVLSLCFGPRSDMLATASEDQTIRLWDVNGRELASFAAPVASASSEMQGGGFLGPPLKFSDDGRWLAVGSEDGVVRLWPVDSLSGLIARGLEWLAPYRQLKPIATLPGIGTRHQ